MTAPLDARTALRAPGLLGEFNRAGILHSSDVHVAARLGALVGEQDPRVLLAAALAVRSTRQGSVMLPLATAPQTMAPLVEEDDGSTPDADVELPWPDPVAWLAAVAASPLVAASDADGVHAQTPGAAPSDPVTPGPHMPRRKR